MQIAAKKKYDVSDKNYEVKECEIAFSCREACNRTSDCVSNFSILIKSLHSLFLSFLSPNRSISSLSIISYHSSTSRMISISLLLPHERHFWIQFILSYFDNQFANFPIIYECDQISTPMFPMLLFSVQISSGRVAFHPFIAASYQLLLSQVARYCWLFNRTDESFFTSIIQIGLIQQSLLWKISDPRLK